MPGEIDLPLPDAASLTLGRFTYFPVVPGRMEFAIEVRKAILRDRPQVGAVDPVAGVLFANPHHTTHGHHPLSEDEWAYILAHLLRLHT